MSQARINHLMVLNYHQESTNRLHMKCIANEYISTNESKGSMFVTFPDELQLVYAVYIVFKCTV